MAGSEAAHPAADLVGTVLAEYTMDIERGKVREFARATGAKVDPYLAADAPIPPTFLVTSTFWAPEGSGSAFRDLGLDLRRILHGEQEFRFPNGMPRAGTTLRVRTTVDSISTKQGKRGGSMTFVSTRTEYTDERGELVAESISTIIERGE